MTAPIDNAPKHTPGPWDGSHKAARPDNSVAYNVPIFVHRPGFATFNVAIAFGRTEEEAQANGALIGAASETHRQRNLLLGKMRTLDGLLAPGECDPDQMAAMLEMIAKIVFGALAACEPRTTKDQG